MKVTNDVKIISNGMWCDVYVNGIQMKNITKIDVNLKDQPHRVSLEMYAEVDMETKAILEENNILYINNKKYKLQEV